VDTIPVAGSIPAVELVYGDQTEVVIGFSRIMDGEKVFQEVKFKDEITIELQRVEGRLQSIDHVDYGATCGMSGIVECVVRSGACIEMRE